MLFIFKVLFLIQMFFFNMYVYYYIIVWRGRIVSTCPIKMYIELNPVLILFVLLFLKDLNFLKFKMSRLGMNLWLES